VAVGAGEDGAVVREQRRRQAVQLGRFVEAVNDVGCFDPAIRIRAEEQARVVIDLVEDLDDLTRCQLPGADVCLPQLVGELCFKADER